MIQIGINIAVKGASVSGTPPTPAPVNTVLPDITGTAVVGNQLSAWVGGWTNSPTSYDYQWKRGATNIGVNDSYYILVNADAGQSITCVVTATNGGGSTPATSNAVQIQNFCTTEWTTIASSETIELPYNSGASYSGTIDWGDGNTSANSYANRTHTYATAGTYTVVIDGAITEWNFGSIFGSTYITSVVHWGQLQLGTNAGLYFSDCPNLDLSSVSDVLDLTGITDLTYMFGGCTSLTSINRIGEWNTSGVTVMGSMFQFCGQINFNIGTWNVAAVTGFTDFMADATPTFSTTNLNAIYNGWINFPLQSNINISFGTAQYTAASAANRAALVSFAYNWTITDGGII
jgi:surface protein